MRALDLIPTRRLDYEPPSTCGWAAAGAIASIAGTGLSMLSAKSEADYASAVARNQSILDMQKANEDAAIGQRAAITETRRTNLALSRAQAVAAASGTDATSPSTLDLQQDLAQQGGYNAMTALYEGMARSRGDQYQSELDLFKSQRAAAAGPMNAAAALFGGVSRLADSRSLLKLFGEQ